MTGNVEFPEIALGAVEHYLMHLAEFNTIISAERLRGCAKICHDALDSHRQLRDRYLTEKAAWRATQAQPRPHPRRTEPPMADGLMAGRELDALVAEKVMGYYWHAWEHSAPFAYLIAPGDEELGEASIARRRNGVFETDEYNGAHYSTDIAAAWLVVEHLRAQGYGINLDDHLTAWDISITGPGGLETQVYDQATAPLAICLGALKIPETEERA